MNEKESTCDCTWETWEGEEKDDLQDGSRKPSKKTRRRPTKAVGHAQWEKHGMTRSVPEYRIWRNMRFRCNAPSCDDYHRYGGRGIKVCVRWTSFTKFLSDMGPRPSLGHSIDRRDNNRGYCPHNCRWATDIVQNNNTRFNRVWETGKTTAQLARECGLSWACTDKRLKRGIPLHLPLGVSKHYIRVNRQ